MSHLTLGWQSLGRRHRRPRLPPVSGLHTLLSLFDRPDPAGRACRARRGSWLSGIWEILSTPRVIAALRVSFVTSLLAAAFNVPVGVLVAWVLGRYHFPGRRLLDAMVDLPFALPTAVAGISLSALYAQNGWIGALSALSASRSPTRPRHLGRAGLHRPALRRSHFSPFLPNRVRIGRSVGDARRLALAHLPARRPARR